MKSFNEVTSLNSDTIMIVDALNLAFRSKHHKETDYLDSYIRTVESLKRSYRASKVVIACDSGSSSFRKSIFPDYKKARKDKFDQQTEEEKQEFEEFFRVFNNIIDTYIEVGDYPVFRFDKCEADDIAAFITNRYKKNNIWLISSDKDWDLLVRSNVSRFSYVTRKEITEENWNEHYEYDLEDHISIKCLTGDSGDSIPGVPGIGPKKALALVKEFGSTYDIIASLPIQSKYKHIQALNEFGANNLLRNYKLMDLVSYCEDALGTDNCNHIARIMDGYVKS